LQSIDTSGELVVALRTAPLDPFIHAPCHIASKSGGQVTGSRLTACTYEDCVRIKFIITFSAKLQLLLLTELLDRFFPARPVGVFRFNSHQLDVQVAIERSAQRGRGSA
jgi:hypothetical protein